MFRKTVECVAVACAVLTLMALLAGPTSADDKDKGGLSGVWVRKAGEMKIEFPEKGVMKLFPHGDNEVLVVVCKVTADKDGLVKAKITDLEGKAKDKAKDVVPVGLEFSFKWKVKGDAATLSDVKGEKAEMLKSHLEDEYSQKK